MKNKLSFAACPRCGCSGIHACIGFKPPKLTLEEERKYKEEFMRFIEIIKNKRGTEDESKATGA